MLEIDNLMGTERIESKFLFEAFNDCHFPEKHFKAAYILGFPRFKAKILKLRAFVRIFVKVFSKRLHFQVDFDSRFQSKL